MAPSSTKQSSRFSTFKVFKFTGSKPPPPPPKDPNYLYSTSNPSVLSFSNHSVSIDSISQPPTPYVTSYQVLARSPSPAPSRATQSPASSSALTPDSAAVKKGFFNIGSLGKRSFSRSSRATTVEEPVGDDESISMPWNFQHHVHVDEALKGLPSAWSTSLAEAGFSEAEIIAIQQARRTRSPALDSIVPPSSYSRSQSPSSVATSAIVNPRPRSSSLLRQRSDASLARSDRSTKPTRPPPPLPLSTRKYSNAASASTGTNPAVDRSYSEIDATESIAAHSDMNYVYVDHNRRDTALTITPDRVQTSLDDSISTIRMERRPEDPRPVRPRTPPRKVFRVVNETPPDPRSPPPAYASPTRATFTDENDESPPALYSSETSRPFRDEKARPADKDAEVLERDVQVSSVELEESFIAGATQPNTSERHDRPPKLSILPPRLSLRKDTIDDLSSWTEALFSSIPTADENSPHSAAAQLSATPLGAPEASSSRLPPWTLSPQKTVPDIIVNSGPREEEGEDENDYSFSASPLYNELMGMMQERPPVRPLSPSTIPASESPGIPASPNFSSHLDTADSRGRSSARDSSNSQLTLRLDPRRNSDRDSNASSSTITHATIVRGASVVRRAPANMIISPSKDGLGKGKQHEGLLGGFRMDELEEDEEEGGLGVPRLPQVAETTPRQSIVGRPNSRRSSWSSSHSSGSGSGYGFSDSPPQTLSVTSGSNSQEDSGSKSPKLPYVQSPPPPRSPLRSEFHAEEEEAEVDEEEEEADEEEGEDGEAVPPRRSSIVIMTDDVASLPKSSSLTNGNRLDSSYSPASADTPKSVSPHSQRYPGWLSEVVKPLSDFVDDTIDPRDLFVDLQEIAEGESGSVYAAHVVASSPSIRRAHTFQPPSPTSPFPGTSFQDVVAVKCVPILPSGSPKLLDLRRELELMRDLRHPNVLKMERLYVDLVEDSLWIGMELMERSLADVLGVGAEEGGEDVVIGEKMVARFVWDVLLALSYIHKQHIAHRDLRSDNLLLNKDGVLKLSDFSSAVRAPPGTPKSSENVGVIYWQAPEMRTGLYDPLKVDVWSLGATAWELLEGEPPFSDVQDTRQIRNQLPPLSQPDIYSRSFHDFLHLCSQPVASRPDPDELLNAHFIRTSCPRSAIVQMLAQCKIAEEQRLRRQSIGSQGTFTMS